ncbi:MAG TPA: hypothetical protein VG815_11425, partial [Chloroflexota bacterium]|nr:hypothetical protein [Chloroflexota bacterium]
MSDCTTCQQKPQIIPIEIDNRPGLAAIVYRIGTFPTFRAALLDLLSTTPELAGLRTRESDDYSITLIELWSAVADILTFYQERIANEAYLRTATLRDSVLRLVRLIDYQLQPGLAATTLLSFTLEKAATTTIPIGLRVQSVPVGTVPPQKFETIESINADARFNSLSIYPAPEIVQPLSPGRVTEIVAPGADLAAFAATLAPGDQIVAYTKDNIEFLKIAAVTTLGDRIQLQWAIPPVNNNLSAAANGLSTASGLFKIGRTFRLFGQDAPSTFVAMTLADLTDPNSIRGTLATLDQLELNLTNGFSLNGVYPGLKPNAQLLIVAAMSSGPPQLAFATIQTVSDGPAQRTATSQGSSPTTVTSPISGTATNLTAASTTFTPGAVSGAAIYELIGPQLRLSPLAFPSWLSEPDIYLPGRRNGFSSVEVNRTIVKGAIQPGITVATTDLPAGREVILVDADPTAAMSAAVVASDIVGDELLLSLAGNDVSTVQQLGIDPSVAQPITAMVSPSFSGLVTLRNSQLQILVTIGQLPSQTVTLALSTTGAGPWNFIVNQVATALQNALQSALPGAPEFAQAQVFNSHHIAGGPACLVVVPGVPGQAMTIKPTSLDPDTIVDLGLDATNARYLDGVLTGPLNLTTPGPATLTAQVAMLPRATVSFKVFANASHTADSLAFGIFIMLHAASPGVFTGRPLVLYLSFNNRILALPPVAQFERPAYLHLALAPDGSFGLDATTAVLLGNVAQASQGETVANEIVGDGNASAPFQTFTLKKDPVTFLLGNGPHGAESTLTVAVNGVEWTEVPTLYNAKPADQVFVTRVADDTTLTMEFGDGVTGARVTTGRANIVANYRTGLGLAGRVGANTLTTLLDVPNGL